MENHEISHRLQKIQNTVIKGRALSEEMRKMNECMGCVAMSDMWAEVMHGITELGNDIYIPVKERIDHEH